MTPEERFHHYYYVVKLTIDNLYKSEYNAADIAHKYGMDYQDLLQIGYAELWKMALKHDDTHTNFFGFVQTAVRYSVIEATARKGNLIKLPVKDRQEIRDNLHINDIKDYEDFLPATNNVEDYVIRKIEVENRFNRIKNPINVKIVKLSLQGYADKEIEEILGVTSVLSRRFRAMKKMVG